MIPANMQVASKTGVVVGIPTLGRPVSLDWASAFKSLHPPINYNMTVCQIKGAPVADARNAIVREALRVEARYVFFLGDDVIVPGHTLRQLIFRMENNPSIGVVGGVYCSKSTPAAPLVFRGNGCGTYWDWKIGEFFEVTGLGMDCTLIRTDLFREISEPWFKTVDTDQFDEGINRADQWTEDLYFLHKVSKETKHQIWCDGSIVCDHEDVFGGKKYSLEPYSLPCRKAAIESKDGRSAIDIGSGPIRRTIEGLVPIRVDAREDVEPDYRCDVRNLPFASESFDIVFSSHVLEHFGRHEWKDTLKEWLRLVKTDGKAIIVVPNIAWAAHRMAIDHIIDTDVMNVLYGSQSYFLDYHKNGFTPELLKEGMSELGFDVISTQTEHYNLVVEAKRKPAVPELKMVVTETTGAVSRVIPQVVKSTKVRKKK